MVSDTDLVKGDIGRPQRKGYRTKKKATPPNEGLPVPKKRAKLLLLLVANIIVGIVLYNQLAPESLWKPGPVIASLIKDIRNWELPTGQKITVTGIMYYGEKQSAIVCGQVVYEGETIAGHKVVKINKQDVVFEKDGVYLKKSISR